MRTSTPFFLMILSGLLLSCEEDAQPCYPVDSNQVHIQVVDGDGKDLLDQTDAGAYQSSTIKIYYERNGSLEEFYNGDLSTMRRNFRIDPPNVEVYQYSILVILEAEKTVIQWNAVEADTLVATIASKDSPDFCPTARVSEIYHHGELKWDGSTSQTRREFTIVKERP